MNKISSPLYPEGPTLLVQEFSTKKIINSYKDQNVDVRRFFDQKNVGLYKCLATGYRFFYPPAVIGDESFYEELSKKRKNYYSDRWEHERSLKFINHKDNVLEIGSGFGSFLKILRARGIEARGIELNPHAVEECKKENLDVKGVLIDDLVREDSNRFDVICSFQVLEHVYDVQNFLGNQIKMLKKGGKLIVGVPNNNPFLFISDKYHTLNLPPHHAGLWNKQSLLALEKIFDLELEKMMFEPLSNSYGYFVSFHLNNIKDKRIRRIFIKIEKIFRKPLRRVISTFINGRNVLVIYRKL